LNAMPLAELDLAATPCDFRLHRHTVERVRILRLAGRLSAAAAEPLRAVLRWTANESKHLVVDLRAAEHIDTACVAVLRRAHRERADSNGLFCLAAAPSDVRTMLDAPHFDNVDHALNWLYTRTDRSAQPIFKTLTG
jgi:anti-anti-sigma factor